MREPRLLLADEPFGALDALTRIRMHTLLRKLCEAHKPAVLLVTHDVDEAIVLADRVILLDGGVVGADVRVNLCHRSQADPGFAPLRAFLDTADHARIDAGRSTEDRVLAAAQWLRIRGAASDMALELRLQRLHRDPPTDP